MGRGGAGLFAAVLLLAGCKSTDPKSTDKDPVGTAASRNKDGDAPWYAPISGQPSVPEIGDPVAGRKSNSTQDVVSGRVLDPFNRPVENVDIQIEAVNAAANTRAPVGIRTDQNGAFYTNGLKPGKSYNLSVEKTIDGKYYSASVQTLIPNANITIVLKDNLGLPPVGILKGPASGSFPPQPSPYDSTGDRIPPQPTVGSTPRPNDGAWTPGADANKPVPTTVTPPTRKPTPTPPAGAVPAPSSDDLLFPPKPTGRPENVAEGPKNTFTPPPASIPGPPSLPPSYPNPVPPPPSPPDPVKIGLGMPKNGFILVDTLERDWLFPANKSGSVVLLEFMTTTCPHSKRAISVLTDLQARYAVAGLQVIAVACDDEADTRKPPIAQKQRLELASKYTRDNSLNYQVFVEPGPVSGSVRNRYNIKGYPTVVLLDGTGAVLWQGHPHIDQIELEAAIKRALGK